MLLTAFGLRIKELREAGRLSQADLAEMSGIERAQISKIEKGKVNATLETIEKLANALGIKVSELMNFKSQEPPHPFVKWAGGKTQIIGKLKSFLPESYGEYYEPFVGGGALLFALAPQKAHINDQNGELICAFECFKDNYSFAQLKKELKKHEGSHSEDYYLQIRGKDREDGYASLPVYEKAARLIYLNKSCFNGLYRVNSNGYFNVPSGKKERVITFDESNFTAIKEYFDSNDVTITNEDYERVVSDAKSGDFVYFDPPYDVAPDKHGFVDYGKDGFGKEEQARLAKCYKELSDKGVKVMLSNLNTEFVNDLYKDFNIHVIQAKRMINSKGDGRGNVEEVIITNY